VSVREAIENADADPDDVGRQPRDEGLGVRPTWLCRNRDEVSDMVRHGLEGRTAHPEVVAEREDILVVDPHLDPPNEQVPGVHQVFVLRDGVVAEIRDYVDRDTALAAVAG
jgi:hypothetical protein